MPLTRRSLVFTAPYAVDIVESDLTSPQAGQVVVETAASGISAGSEMLVYRGQFPRDLAVDETIAALEGGFSYPARYGYAAVGHVRELGPDVDPQWADRLVFAFQPHASHFVAGVADLLPLPAGLPPEAGVFLPNMETAVSLVMDGRPVVGERVAVVGQGVVGLLTAWLLGQLPLAALVTMDGLALRRRWSQELGAAATFAPDAVAEASAALAAPPEAGPDGADLTFELSGDPRALDSAIALTGYGGRIVVGSWYGVKRAAVDLGGRFHRDHIRLISSQVSHLGPRWLARWTKPRRLALAVEMLAHCRPERLITHRFPVESAASAYALLDESPGEAVQVVLTY